MLSAVAWVPRGAAKPVPQVAEPTPEELELMKQEIEEQAHTAEIEEESEENEDEWEEVGEEEMKDIEAMGEGEEEGRQEEEEAKSSKPRGKKDSKNKKGSKKGKADDLANELAELDMDRYDEEDEKAINLFGTGRGVGNAYYKSNEDDPYIVDEEDEFEEEKDDLTIRDSDLLLLAARNEDDVSFIELWVCEEPKEGEREEEEGGGEEFNMYVHHDVMLPAFPLAMAWMDFDAKGGSFAGPSSVASSSTPGSFVAVATMNPEIEIWNLDVLDEVEPVVTLGGFDQTTLNPKPLKKNSKKKSRKAKSSSNAALKPGSHSGAVMCLSWNREFRNVLASGGEDGCVKIWDMSSQLCQHTLTQHQGKVQSVSWCPTQPSLLLSGSFDRTVALVDCRAPDAPCLSWHVSADVESTAWDPLNEHRFLVSTEDGHVSAFDARTGQGNKGGKGVFTLAAHDKATCTMSFNPRVPHLLATGSTDKKVKLWDLSADEPKNLSSYNPKAGAVFSVAFCGDSPSILAIGGSKGTLNLWNVSQVKGVSSMFRN